MPGKELTHINFKVIGLTRPGFEPATFGLSDLPEREAGVLLIRPLRLVVDGICVL